MSTMNKISESLRKKSWRAAANVSTMAIIWFALAAAILALAVPDLGSVGRILLFSEMVGCAIVAVGLLLQRVLWSMRSNSFIAMASTTIAAVPIGYVIGHFCANLLLGEPMHISGAGPHHMVPYLATVLTAILFLYSLWSRGQVAKAVAAGFDAKRSAAESELRLLRAQIEPHMLFNTLANLRSLVNDDPVQAQIMIDQIIVYLRSALAASRTESVKLGDEFAQLRAYLEIMSLRMGSRLSFQLLLPEPLQNTAIPPMLLQPLVENAIKHGVEPKIGSSRIEVEAKQTDAGIAILVTDTGLGLTPESGDCAPSSKSYGLIHVRQRLLAAYGPTASLSLTRHMPQGVCAIVKIPT